MVLGYTLNNWELDNTDSSITLCPTWLAEQINKTNRNLNSNVTYTYMNDEVRAGLNVVLLHEVLAVVNI